MTILKPTMLCQTSAVWHSPAPLTQQAPLRPQSKCQKKNRKKLKVNESIVSIVMQLTIISEIPINHTQRRRLIRPFSEHNGVGIKRPTHAPGDPKYRNTTVVIQHVCISPPTTTKVSLVVVNHRCQINNHVASFCYCRDTISIVGGGGYKRNSRSPIPSTYVH